MGTSSQYADIPPRVAALHYGVAAVAVVGAAFWLPHLGAELARQTGLGEAFVGSLFIAISTAWRTYGGGDGDFPTVRTLGPMALAAGTGSVRVGGCVLSSRARLTPLEITPMWLKACG